MVKNIFIELELSLDPPIAEAGAMKEHLEKEKIPFWQKNQHCVPRYEFFIGKARRYIAELPRTSYSNHQQQLEQQAKEALGVKYYELTSLAKIINDIGVTEGNVKILVNDFKKFFREDMIKSLVPLGSLSPSESSSSDDEFVPIDIPYCPDSLKCEKPVSYADMLRISEDLEFAGEGKWDTLYTMFGLREREENKEDTARILTKAKAMSKEIYNMPKAGIKAAPLNRLLQKCMLYFKDDNARKNYDVAIRRFCFDEYANKTLKFYTDAWITKMKTDWDQYYYDCIGGVMRLVVDPIVAHYDYDRLEANWLVYEYFCITKKCPLPETKKVHTEHQSRPSCGSESFD